MRRSGNTRKVLFDGGKMGKVMLGLGSGDENRSENEMRNVMGEKRTMMNNVRSPPQKKIA